MKDKRKNIREPYPPENTPRPPQTVDPNRKNQKDAPAEGASTPDKKNESGKMEKPHLLDEDTAIEDETTI
jgi:hypothetical protein